MNRLLGVIFGFKRSVSFSAVFVGVLAFALVGCQVVEGPAPKVPEREVIVKPDTTPKLLPEGDANANKPFFSEVLRQYVQGDGPIAGAALGRVLNEAGFVKESIAFSQDRTKTNLVADSIFVGVLINGSCLLGQVQTGDRSLAVSVADPVGPDHSLCLMGKTFTLE